MSRSQAPNTAEIRPEYQVSLEDLEANDADTANLGDEYLKMVASPGWVDFKARIVNRIHQLDEARDSTFKFREWRAVTTEMSVLRSYLAEPQRIIQKARAAKVRLAELKRIREESGNETRR